MTSAHRANASVGAQERLVTPSPHAPATCGQGMQVRKPDDRGWREALYFTSQQATPRAGQPATLRFFSDRTMAARTPDGNQHDRGTAPASAADVIASWAPHLHIAHQVPGRIRLRLDPTLAGAPALRGAGPDALQRVLGDASGLQSVRLNPLARSCVIEYDKNAIPDAAWPDLLAGRDTAAARILLKNLSACARAAIP